jgi:site-specific recombinase XerD
MNNKITNTDINSFEEFLINENKSRTTLDKYMRDIRRFQIFLSDNCYPISQDTADKYIEILKNADYSISSINIIISCINTFCNFIGRNDIHCVNLISVFPRT